MVGADDFSTASAGYGMLLIETSGLHPRGGPGPTGPPVSFSVVRSAWELHPCHERGRLLDRLVPPARPRSGSFLASRPGGWVTSREQTRVVSGERPRAGPQADRRDDALRARRRQPPPRPSARAARSRRRRARSRPPDPHCSPVAQIYGNLTATRTKPTRISWAFKYFAAGWTGLEPAASGVTGRRYNQLNYHPMIQFSGATVGGAGFEPATPGL